MNVPLYASISLYVATGSKGTCLVVAVWIPHHVRKNRAWYIEVLFKYQLLSPFLSEAAKVLFPFIVLATNGRDVCADPAEAWCYRG